MNVYLDSSVVLRKLQRETGASVRWGEWKRAFSSVLMRVEVLRSIDRNRRRGAITDDEAVHLITEAHAIFKGVEFIRLSDSILDRASESFFSALGTLDALHLATALRFKQDTTIANFTFLTHDAELAIAARAVNLPVQGV